MSTPSFGRADFEQLIAEHQQLIVLVNDLEYQLYLLGDISANEPVLGCQQAAGALISLLRRFLFRQDQQVLPVLECLVAEQEGPISPETDCRADP